MRGVAIYRTMKTFWKRFKNQPIISRIIDHDLKDVVKAIKNAEVGKGYITKKPYPMVLYPLKEQIVE
ncbi:unnamed protein product [marine sediment metagenome]|uniref:Uncharacterized protein n=1 Tax=marine sediment metagenome TaxID=412755 RepID=X1IFR9_9ZZZZ